MKTIQKLILNDIVHKFYRIKSWIAHRTYDKYHVVHLGTKPGFSDSREMLLYANFAVLTHFVENELAKMEIGHRRFKKISYKGLSNRELGLSYLELWLNMSPELSRDGEDLNEGHRNFAKEVRELYLWWKDVRPDRVDINLIQIEELIKQVNNDGRKWYKFVGIEGSKFLTMEDELTESERELRKELRQNSFELEQYWDKEDQEMLHRLIDIRFFLWT